MLNPLKALVPRSLLQRSLKRNIALNWTATLIGAVVSLGLTPITVARLQEEDYGIWTFLNGLTLYSNLLYLGLGSAFVKKMSEAVGRYDRPDQTRLLSVAGTLYTGLGLLCFALAVALAPVVAGGRAPPPAPPPPPPAPPRRPPAPPPPAGGE